MVEKDFSSRRLPMLQYRLSHTEYAFSPQETADLCEAFDMAVAVLQERGDCWATEEKVRTLLSEAIVEARMRGERDPKRLSKRALVLAGNLRADLREGLREGR
jgi:hypothetical protein